MLPDLKGRGLFVFSDPGGAKPLLASIELLSEKISGVKVISNRVYSFYSDFRSQVDKPGIDPTEDIKSFSPDFIFTGTSYTSKIEQEYIKAGITLNIPTLSFVDHWTNISKRFDDGTGKMIFPDKVLVLDERAQKIAIQEGIEETKIIVSGNPYHQWLKNWKPKTGKEDFLKQTAAPFRNKKIIVYAPDPLSNVNGREVYGFDELSATSALVEIFNTQSAALKAWCILIKAHPNQDRNKLSKIIDGQSAFYMLSEDVDTNTTIYYADVVLGFFSSFLIEATVMHKPVLRFMDESAKNDPMADLDIGVVVNKKSFAAVLTKM